MNSAKLTVRKRTEASSPISVLTLEKKKTLSLLGTDNMTAVRCPGAFQAAIVPAISCLSPPGVNKKGLGVMEY